jgi:nicotinamidase-related amidase
VSRKAYIVMDIVNDLVHADGPNGATYGAEVRRRGVLENTARALSKARAGGAMIVFVRVGFDPKAGGKDMPLRSPMLGGLAGSGILSLGKWGTQVHDAVAPIEGDIDVVKHRISPFYATSLDAILRGNDIDTLYLSGVSTNFVVTSAVRDGHDRDFRTFVVEDCCSATNEAEHVSAIENFKPLCHGIVSADSAFK